MNALDFHRLRLTAAASALLLLPLATSCDSDRGSRDAGPTVNAPGADDPDAEDAGDEEDDGHGASDADQPTGLDASFEQAAVDWNVPVEVLKALAWVETRWHMVEGHEELGAMPAAYGLMGLRDDALEEGAARAGLDLTGAQRDPESNIIAAAAYLSGIADDLEIEDRTDIGEWALAIAEYSRVDDSLGREMYVHREVYPAMREGFTALTKDGDVQGGLDPVDAWPSVSVPPPLPAVGPGPDYASALWRPSPNHSSRGSGDSAKPRYIVIHTCEGSYTGCWSWLKNSSSGVSAHYVVNNTGSEITQLVKESRKAWHISANYDCNKNDGVDCWLNGIGSNKFTVGIEHAGYGGQNSWDPGLIDASAKLVCDIAKDNDIPIDAEHIWGHGMMQPWNRSDPGDAWPWAEYIEKAQEYCGEGGGPGDDPGDEPDDPGDEPGDDPDDPDDPGDDPGGPLDAPIVIDSNNGKNDADVGFISVSNNWNSSANVSGYYNTGYWWASTKSVSDGATFWFYLAEGGEHEIDAWWTSGSDRSTSAPFLAFDAGGTKVGQVSVNQRQGGGGWNELGSFEFEAGWNKIVLSRWTSPGNVVVADAVRVR